MPKEIAPNMFTRATLVTAFNFVTYAVPEAEFVEIDLKKRMIVCWKTYGQKQARIAWRPFPKEAGKKFVAPEIIKERRNEG